MASHSNGQQGIISRITESSVFQSTKRVASEAGTVTKKLLRSTGKAAWLSGTTFLVLGFPLFAVKTREMLVDLQETLLGSPSLPSQDSLPWFS